MHWTGTWPIRPSSIRLRRRAAALLGAAALVSATAVGVASPAAAVGTETPLDGVAGVGDVAAGAGKVFVAALDRVVVADSAGAVTDAVTGLPGAVGLALSADGSRLYVALSDSAEVAEIDTGTLGITRRISLAQYPCPTHLSLAGDRLWVGYGCYGQWSGGVVTLDVSAASPTVTSVVGSSYGAPVVAAAVGVLAAGSTGLSPASFDVYSVDGASATLRGTITGDASNLGDLAITPDGATVVAASGYPYMHVAYDTGTLAEVRRYGDPSTFWGYPNAVAISPDGTYLAAGRNGSPRLSVHRVADGATLSQADSTAGDLVARAVTFLGSDVFGVLNDWQAGKFYLWRVAGATLPTSTITLTPPASATALEPLTITGRLSFSDGTAPGAQQLAVTRTLPDDTKATLAPVTTAADGTFSVTDTPPVGGSVRYDVAWDGDAAHRGSSDSVTVSVAKRSPTLTLTGPTTGEAGKRLRLSGALTLDGHAPSPPATLAVYRTIYNNRLGGVTDRLADVVTDSRGGFRFSDTPAQGGRYVYEVRWEGSEVYEAASADHEVSVTSTASQLTASVQQPAYAGEPFWVAGGVSFDVGSCVGLMTIRVTRQVGSGPAERLPDLTTDAACSFRFDDKLALPGAVYYTLTWNGDASHQGASTTVSGIVQKQPSYVQAAAEDTYLRSNQKPVISGVVAGSRTGPLGIALTLIVTRTNPDGSTVRLRDVTTATNGTFSFRDSLPTVDPSTFPAFTYEISWLGNATYEGSSASVVVYVTPTG
jgi:YVTN family beta-propeller protein